MFLPVYRSQILYRNKTKFPIHQILGKLQCESEFQFWLFPPVLESSGYVPCTIIPQTNYASFIFHILQGFYDRSTLAKVKGGKTSNTNRDSACMFYTRHFRSCWNSFPLSSARRMTNGPSNARQGKEERRKGRGSVAEIAPQKHLSRGSERVRVSE